MVCHVAVLCLFWTAERFFVSNFSLTGGFCDDAVPLMWPGGASAVSVAAELLAGPMWGGREGGWKKTDQVKTTTQRYYPTDSMLNHSTCNRFFFSASTVCPAQPWVRERVGPGRAGES